MKNEHYPQIIKMSEIWKIPYIVAIKSQKSIYCGYPQRKSWKIITGSAGGMFLTNSKEDADKVRKWSTQSREDAPWYQHEEIGYNYRMSNIIAGVVRGQVPYLQDHIDQKRAIWERYEKGLADLPVKMNPWDREKSIPNFWLSCMIIDEDAMAPFVRGEQEQLWKHESGKSSPGEILEAIAAFNAEGRPIWKPMHMQPIYMTHAFVTAEGNGRGRSNAYISVTGADVGADIFRRGLCLPSDNKMTVEQQDTIIEIIHRCFGNSEWGLELRLGVFFPHYYNALSFLTAYLINSLVRKANGILTSKNLLGINEYVGCEIHKRVRS